jgi:rhodanese-related sulfurtransferase
MKGFFVVISSLIFLVSGKAPTPAEPPEGVTIVSAEESKLIIEKNKVQVFDMRKSLNYREGHMPNAVSLPYKWTRKGHPSQRTGEFDISKLPADKNKKILFHGGGPNGWKSYYASRATKEAGYKNVIWMREGFSGWKDKGYPVEH